MCLGVDGGICVSRVRQGYVCEFLVGGGDLFELLS